jgi:hypothetical protein
MLASLVSSATPRAPFIPPGLGAADVTGDALEPGIVKPIDDDLVARTQQPERCADGAGGAPLGPVDDPHAKKNDGQYCDGSENNPEPSHDVLVLFSKCGGGDPTRSMPRTSPPSSDHF